MAPDDSKSEMSKREEVEASGLMNLEIELLGTTPLLFNHMSNEKLMGLRDKSRKASKASATVLSPREECVDKVHNNKAGDPAVPVSMLFACLREAGKQVRLDGKKQISSSERTLLPLFLKIETPDRNDKMHFPLIDPATAKTATWEVDICKGTNPGGGEAVVIVRPRFDNWRLRLNATIFTREIQPAMIRRLFDVAGSGCGLGDFRPSCGGTYGCFTVTNWRET